MVDFSLYIIVDEKYITHSLSAIATEICEGGATIIQLREKSKETKEFLEDAILVREITSKYKIPFIVNDRIDIALAAKANGVHLGQLDMPLSYASGIFKRCDLSEGVRRLHRSLTDKGIIGKSVSTVEQAIEAEKEGATYLGVGSLFPSPTKSKPTIKLSVISEIKKAVKIPVLGIGGITLDKVEDVLSRLGSRDGICVASDIFNSPNLKQRAREFKSKIQNAKIIEHE